jgi:branched-subunit amino acid aminotransferase/4-amino-4-deoxychorismate lyase
MSRIEIDGRTATAEALVHPAVSTYGHFTAMQVRDRKVRGMEFHLARLRAASLELFDTVLDDDRVLSYVRHALTDVDDASLRVYVFQPADTLSIMVTVNPPGSAPSVPQRMQSVPYVRPLPQVKHLGGFAQAYYSRAARANGFDDALLVAPDGFIAEGATTNIGFFDGSGVVWPDAPQLSGITMQLLDTVVPSRRTPIRIADVVGMDGAFLANARGLVAVSAIDDEQLKVNTERMAAITSAYDSIPRRAI